MVKRASKAPDMSVRIAGRKFKNPVMVASGTFGEEYGALTDAGKLGAVVAKTATIEARQGNPPPRVVEAASGLINSIGLENKGLSYFLKEKLPGLVRLGAPVVVSVSGQDKREFALLASMLKGRRDVAAIELNLSCPNIRQGKRGHLIAQDERAVAEVVRAARKACDLPLYAKLSPAVADIGLVASAAEEAGADAVVIANTFPAMAVDINTRRPRLGNITGGLSGPAVKPLALKLVWEAYNKVSIPIIGSGGISDWRDALEFILCGATAVQVGTATFTEPKAAEDIIEGIRAYIDRNDMPDVVSLIGGLRVDE